MRTPRSLSESDAAKYGFRWGPVDVTRLCSPNGGVLIGVETERRSLQIFVTPTGLLRVGPINRRVKP